MKKATAILGMLLAAGIGHAGRKSPESVVVLSTMARGSLGTARNSADTTQFIGCATAMVVGSTSYATCSATDERGYGRSCYSYDAGFIQAVRALDPDAHLELGWDPSYVCNFIRVRAMSYDEPRVP